MLGFVRTHVRFVAYNKNPNNNTHAVLSMGLCSRDLALGRVVRLPFAAMLNVALMCRHGFRNEGG